MSIGVVRSAEETGGIAKDWGALVEVDDRHGGAMRMPDSPWRFGQCELPPPGIPYFQGECNNQVLGELGITDQEIAALQKQRGHP